MAANTKVTTINTILLNSLPTTDLTSPSAASSDRDPFSSTVVGKLVGVNEVKAVGVDDGIRVGSIVGNRVNFLVGVDEGKLVGSIVGLRLGAVDI